MLHSYRDALVDDWPIVVMSVLFGGVVSAEDDVTSEVLIRARLWLR